MTQPSERQDHIQSFKESLGLWGFFIVIIGCIILGVIGLTLDPDPLLKSLLGIGIIINFFILLYSLTWRLL